MKSKEVKDNDEDIQVYVCGEGAIKSNIRKL